MIVCSDLDAKELKVDYLVDVCEGDVEGKVVVESVVGFGVIELTKRSIVDGESGVFVVLRMLVDLDAPGNEEVETHSKQCDH